MALIITHATGIIKDATNEYVINLCMDTLDKPRKWHVPLYELEKEE